jgi:hypothetical protein
MTGYTNSYGMGELTHYRNWMYERPEEEEEEGKKEKICWLRPKAFMKAIPLRTNTSDVKLNNVPDGSFCGWSAPGAEVNWVAA